MTWRVLRSSRATVAVLLAGAALIAFAADPRGQAAGRGGQGGGRGGVAPGVPGRNGQPRDNPTESIVGTATLGGTIVVDGAGTPVRRARVTLTGSELRGGRTVLSDDQGHFSFPALPAGRFTMTASKAGFVDMAYGAKRAGRPGTPIQLADGQKLDCLVLQMPRGSVLTGVVIDENGEPSTGTYVRALRYVMRTGERTLQQAGGAQTDDRGIYRIFQLQPGDYIVSAVPRNLTIGDMRASISSEIASLMQQAQAQGGAGGRGGIGAFAEMAGSPAAQQLMSRAMDLQQQLSNTDQEQPTAYAPVYFPGTTSPGTATTITLGAGDEHTGVDFQLQLVTTAKIEGTVIVPDGAPRPTVALVPNDRTTLPGLPGLGTNTTQLTPDGHFVFRNVAPGQYIVHARANVFRIPADAAPAAGPAGRGGRQLAQVLWASADVSVNGQDESGVTLTLQPGLTVSGRVEFQGGQAPADSSGTRVTLVTRGVQTFETGPVPPAVVDASGHFTIAGVPPGRYVFSAAVGQPGGAEGRGGMVFNAPPGSAANGSWTLKSALAGGRDALDFPIDLGANQDAQNVVLTFVNRTQELSGTIQDAAGRPTSDFTIIVFPTDSRYWLPQSRRIASTRPGTDGRFTLRGLPAGEYRLTAVTDAEPGEWYDPAFLSQLQPASIPIPLAEGETKTQDIKLAN